MLASLKYSDKCSKIMTPILLSGLLAGSLLFCSSTDVMAQSLSPLDWDAAGSEQMTTVDDIMNSPSMAPEPSFSEDYTEEESITPVSTIENSAQDQHIHSADMQDNDLSDTLSPADAPQIRDEHKEVTSAETTSQNVKMETVVSYSPVPSVVVFPVLKHHGEKAFGDLPMLFASEFSLLLEGKMPESVVMNPVYTVDSIKMQGLGHIYNKVMDYYVKAGRPEPKAMDYLLRQIESQDKPITRVIFVEADLDLTDPTRPKGLWGIRDRFRSLLDDTNPSNLKYHVRSRIHVFNAEEPAMPKMWTFNWKRPVKLRDFENVTASVYQDSDNIRVLGQESRVLGRSMLMTLPKHVYMEKHVTTGVKGQLAGK